MPRPKVASTACDLCGNQERGYTRVVPDATSESASQAYTSIVTLLGGVFPFKELVLCRSHCWRYVIHLAKELNKVIIRILIWIVSWFITVKIVPGHRFSDSVISLIYYVTNKKPGPLIYTVKLVTIVKCYTSNLVVLHFLSWYDIYMLHC